MCIKWNILHTVVEESKSTNLDDYLFWYTIYYTWVLHCEDKNLTLSQKKTPSLLVQTVERQGISEQDWLEIKNYIIL